MIIKTRSLSDLSEVGKTFLPTKEEVSLFKERGWVASKSVLSDALIDNAIKGAESFYAGERDFVNSKLDKVANDLQETVLRNNEFVTLQKREIQELGFHPIIGAIAAALCETNEIRLFADSLICKNPAKIQEKGIVGWHTDKAYWPTCTSDNLITVWIPLQDCTIEMGPITYIDGSHKWKDDSDLKSFYSFNNQNLVDFVNHLKIHKPNHKRSIMNLKKGQIRFHNCNVIHCSMPNISNQKRLALALHLQDGNNQYQKVYKPNGDKIVIGYDKICERDINGDPDYSENTLFPLIFKTD